MPADTSVKFIHSGITGAPQNTANTPGSIIAILDAALVDGFGTATIDSLVIANNVATVTINAGHPFEVDSVVLIAGATPVELNGEHRILATTTTTYSFETVGITDQTATGTITHKVAPLGWEKPFSGTSLAVYRPADLLSTRCFLWVDDTQNSVARVRGYLNMTDVDTGTDAFPSITSVGLTGFTWFKSSYSASGNAGWSLIGDGRRFILHIDYYNNNSNEYFATWFFGDFVSLRTGDPYACMITGENSTTSIINQGNNRAGSLTRLNSSTGSWAPKNVTGVGGPAGAARYANSIVGGSDTGRQSGRDFSTVYPNTADNSILLGELYLADSSPLNLRGRIPGIYPVFQNVTSIFTNRSRVEGVIGHPGKKFIALRDYYSVMLYDITGPWE